MAKTPLHIKGYNILCIALCGVFAPTVSSAQIPVGQEPSNALVKNTVPCRGEVITQIAIHTRPPFAPEGSKIMSRTGRFLTSMHATTRPSVIRRFLALKVGDRCSELRRRESERILRAQPYLADATISAYPDGEGGIVLDITTVDEVSLVFDGRVSGKSPIVQVVRLGETNLAGRGVLAVAAWENNEFYRDTYRAKMVHYQFLGRPYQLATEWNAHPHGDTWEIQASYPFITDIQRVSWRVTTGAIEGYMRFLRPNADPASLKFKRLYSDLGGLYAFGPPGKLFLVGASLSREREMTGMSPVVVSDSGVIPDTSQILIGRYQGRQTNRVNLLLGYRDVQLMRVMGFDALEGSQDVRTGLQISTLLGKGLKISDGDEEDYFVSGSAYYGLGNPNSFFATEVLTERRRDTKLDRWDGVLASGRAAWYYKPRDRHTVVSGLEFSGGWRQRVPFQLSFEDQHGGLRGFHKSHLAGGQRVVLRLEDRVRIRQIRQFASLGGAMFMDAGKLWAGDVPFGVNTGVHASVGVGVLVAIPPRSRRLWRMDLAMPLTDRKQSKFEIRFSTSDHTRWFWREPGDVQTSRERSVPTSVYNWP
jgi:hypothetical protein